MTAEEIRGLVVELKMKVPRDAALVLLAEIAAQLAEINERLSPGASGFNVSVDPSNVLGFKVRMLEPRE
jgi:hypothetical protein